MARWVDFTKRAAAAAWGYKSTQGMPKATAPMLAQPSRAADVRSPYNGGYDSILTQGQKGVARYSPDPFPAPPRPKPWDRGSWNDWYTSHRDYGLFKAVKGAMKGYRDFIPGLASLAGHVVSIPVGIGSGIEAITTGGNFTDGFSWGYGGTQRFIDRNISDNIRKAEMLMGGNYLRDEANRAEAKFLKGFHKTYGDGETDKLRNWTQWAEDISQAGTGMALAWKPVGRSMGYALGKVPKRLLNVATGAVIVAPAAPDVARNVRDVWRNYEDANEAKKEGEQSAKEVESFRSLPFDERANAMRGSVYGDMFDSGYEKYKHMFSEDEYNKLRNENFSRIIDLIGEKDDLARDMRIIRYGLTPSRFKSLRGIVEGVHEIYDMAQNGDLYDRESLASELQKRGITPGQFQSVLKDLERYAQGMSQDE